MLKLLILLTLIFSGTWAHAKRDLELNLSTYHYFESCVAGERLSNKAYDCGKGITNPILGLYDYESKLRIFMGANSVGAIMTGVTTDYNNFVLGAYIQDVSEFKRRRIDPFTIATYGDAGLTPIVGYNLTFRPFHDKMTKVFTIVTPILATVGIGFTID